MAVEDGNLEKLSAKGLDNVQTAVTSIGDSTAPTQIWYVSTFHTV